MKLLWKLFGIQDAVDQAFERRADQVEKITDAILEARREDGMPSCTRPGQHDYGKWSESARSDLISIEGEKKLVVGTSVLQERRCLHCGIVQGRAQETYLTERLRAKHQQPTKGIA